jgi:hypothetical protein
MIIGNMGLTGNDIRMKMIFCFNNILSTHCHFKGLHKVFVKCDYPTYGDVNVRKYPSMCLYRNGFLKMVIHIESKHVEGTKIYVLCDVTPCHMQRQWGCTKRPLLYASHIERL